MSRFGAPLAPARELDLVERARGRSAAVREAAFDEIFVSLRASVYSLCLHVTGHPADAEDATQETFLSVHRALRQFRAESRLSTWIYRIAFRAAIRTKAGRPREREALPETASAGASAPPRDEAADVLRALQRLSAEHRMILSLATLEELSHRDIAEMLGIPEGTVWSRLHSARKRLAEELDRP